MAFYMEKMVSIYLAYSQRMAYNFLVCSTNMGVKQTMGAK